MEYQRLFWLLLALLLTACLSPAAPTPTATSQVTVRITAIISPTNTPTPNSTFIPTSTYTRMPTRTPTVTKTPRPTLTPIPTFALLTTRLPHALYFLSEGTIETEYGARPKQIWRLDPDGVTLTEITHEIDGVAEFDISLATGYLTYVIDQYVGDQHGGSQFVRNQLIAIRTDGTGRRVVVDEGPGENGKINRATGPYWSPNGKILAFHQGGIAFYRIGDGQVVKIYADQIDEQKQMSGKGYYPRSWSLDGKRLLVAEIGYEGGWWMLYDLQSKTLTRLSGPYSYEESATWSSDSRWAVFTGAYLMGGDCRDLLQLDALTQMGSVLISCEISQEKYSNLGWPLLTPSSDLLYFYGEAKRDGVEYASAPWRIMRAKLDGEESPVLLRSGIPVNVSEALWAEDGTLAVVNFDDRSVAVVPTDNSQPLQFVAIDGKDLRWGP